MSLASTIREAFTRKTQATIVREITFRELINPRGKQGTFTTRLLVKSTQGVAMVFEDAFVVFSRFLSLKSRGCALLETHRQRETTGIKKLYNSFFVMF
ncbi:hypothetical protein ANTPLA_LOCUS7405 [Anthophora plagiata]